MVFVFGRQGRCVAVLRITGYGARFVANYLRTLLISVILSPLRKEEHLAVDFLFALYCIFPRAVWYLLNLPKLASFAFVSFCWNQWLSAHYKARLDFYLCSTLRQLPGQGVSQGI